MLSRTLMLLALLLTFGWSGAKAEGSGTQDDPYVIKAGETLTMPQMKKFYAKFVVPEDVTSDDAAGAGIFTVPVTLPYLEVPLFLTPLMVNL